MKKRGGSLLFLVGLMGLIVYVCVALSSMNTQITEAARTEQELSAEIERLQEDNFDLQYALAHQDDPETISDIAREKLGLVMPDERIYYDAGD